MRRSRLAGMAFLLILELSGPAVALGADKCTAAEIDQLLDRFEKAIQSGKWEDVTSLSLWAENDAQRERAWKSYLGGIARPKEVHFEDRQIVGGGVKVQTSRKDILVNDFVYTFQLVYQLRRVNGACKLEDRLGGA
jgi:hypothetical protein